MKSLLTSYWREHIRSFIVVHHGKKEFVWILLIVSPGVCQDCVLIISLPIKKSQCIQQWNWDSHVIKYAGSKIVYHSVDVDKHNLYGVFFLIHNLYCDIIKNTKQHYFLWTKKSIKSYLWAKKSINIFNLLLSWIMYLTSEINNMQAKTWNHWS